MKRFMLATVAMTALLAPAAASAQDARLEARAILPADATFPAPFPGVPNTDPAPAPGAAQPVGGFSALLDAGNGSYWAMPDNGFGNKTNSRSFILRLYKVRPNWRTEWSGRGTVNIQSAITLSDPDEKVPFPIVNETTPERILTGGDFDIESVRQLPDGTFYFGEEFGPFLLHVDAQGKVLDAPIAIPRIGGQPRVQSPDNPYLFGRTPNLGGSSGFEAMALSHDGKFLYPILENAVTGDDPLIRRVYEFDVKERRYTGRTWNYRMTQPGLFVSDAVAIGRDQLIVTERDNNQGEAAAWKKAFVIDVPDRRPNLAKREIVDLLNIRDRDGISLFGARPGDFGLGNPFEFPYVTVEAVLPLSNNELLFVNDTNFGSTGRNSALPDYSDFIVLKVPGIRN
ncbi:esterase-like activity of phytase family protein [Solirubrobacter sp. CPCC 204708]|uniref:Esterase-like activity of phytase family protein n=1 Tax=Solirubrobacter deserti TaxID=2282478 RepID=A0ABT4RRC1_9ACTN|nr:esterase-like activity of phytase family protein [Solirubrobacter deserti]MBE2314730.1 esterase-like activity of phytase family protein [Solirubrobacter deserti]MDA0141047.1 esterase-like activity of phytase family protein [Solirubrobacter deserti]